MQKTITIPSTYVPTLLKVNAVASLCKNSTAPDFFHYNGFRYIVTGFVGAGDGKGYESFSAMQAIPISQYKGTVPPMLYDEAFYEVLEGKRERGYHAMIVNVRGANYVMTESVTFNIFIYFLNKLFKKVAS